MNEVKMNRMRSPPVEATAISKKIAEGWLGEKRIDDELLLVEQGFVIVLQATWLSKGLCLSSSGLEPSPVAVDYIVYFKSIQKYYFRI